MGRNFMRHKYYLLLLTAVFFVLIYLFVPEGSVFGSNTDWMSQHATLAETLRDACLQQKTILPDFLWLGGGSNVYEFSYYGYLRPDILLGCLFPDVPMLYFLTVYMMLCILASGLLGYALLIQNKMEPLIALIGSVLLMTAGCFFQAHRQVMFVNYMPYEILALLLLPKLIEKGKYTLFTLMLTLVIVNSFYYSITVLAVMLWRMYELGGNRKQWFVFLRSMAVGIGLAGVLLLPTALVLLEHRRKGAATELSQLFVPDLSLEGLLYQPYGMGLTLIALYALLAGLTIKALRKRSLFLLAAVLFPAVSYVLNGMLYARAKILIPLLPLVILQTACVLQRILDRKLRIRIWPEFLFAGTILGGTHLFLPESEDGIWLDIVLLIMVLCLVRFYNRRRVYCMLLVAPFVCSVYTSRRDDFVAEDQWISPFTEEEAKEAAEDPWARMDGMEEPLMSANRLLFPGQKTSTMYSSVSNQAYASWFFDIMRMPIRINNRTAMLCEVNPFQEYLMGVKYLQTTADKIPFGYEIVSRKGNSVIARNENVLPAAWFSSSLMSEEAFYELEFPWNVEALMNATVTESGNTKENGKPDGTLEQPDRERGEEQAKKTTQDSRPAGEKASETGAGPEGSAIRETIPLFSKAEVPEDIRIERKKDSIAVKAKKQGILRLSLDQPVKDQIVILEFDVRSSNGRRVTIDVNGSRNRLSSAGAAYPNENTRFTYYLTVPEGESLESLEINLCAGDYELSEFRWYEYPTAKLVKEDAVPVRLGTAKGSALLSGTAEAQSDGYFVTSIPYQRGFRLLVDGQEVPVEKVNTAFVGAELSKGTHTVELSFTPPGKKAGLAVSAVALYLLIFCPVWDKVRKKKDAASLLKTK